MQSLLPPALSTRGRLDAEASGDPAVQPRRTEGAQDSEDPERSLTPSGPRLRLIAAFRADFGGDEAKAAGAFFEERDAVTWDAQLGHLGLGGD